MGTGIALPAAFLEAAASGYLTDADWDALLEDWLEPALAYTAAPCKGTRGPLAPIRPRIPDPASRPAYRLSDYLEQQGRRARRAIVPPASFWDAAVHFANPSDLAALSGAAQDHGLLRDAARLSKRATALGDSRQAGDLIWLCHYLRPSSFVPAPVQWAVARISLDDPGGIARLLDFLLKYPDAKEQVTALLARDPAASVSLDDRSAVEWLVDILKSCRADQQAAVLARRAAHIPLDDLPVLQLPPVEPWPGEEEGAAALLARDPAASIPLDDPSAVAWLLNALREAGRREQVAALLARDPAASVSLDKRFGGEDLLIALQRAGAEEQFKKVVDRLACEGHYRIFFLRPLRVRYRPNRFGREPDGSPAPPWDWADLD
jgi:hypothetical protein